MITSEKERAAWEEFFFRDHICCVCNSVKDSGAFSGEDYFCRDCASPTDVLLGRVDKGNLIHKRNKLTPKK